MESTFFLMPTSFISKFDRFMPIDVPCMELGDVSNAIDETNISSGPYDIRHHLVSRINSILQKLQTFCIIAHCKLANLYGVV